MSLDTASFFESPRRDSATLTLDVDSFFGERIDLAPRGKALEDALTDGTSPRTPARSEGWFEEDEEPKEDGK